MVARAATSSTDVIFYTSPGGGHLAPLNYPGGGHLALGGCAAMVARAATSGDEPYRTVQYRTVPFRTVPFHAVPYLPNQ